MQLFVNHFKRLRYFISPLIDTDKDRYWPPIWTPVDTYMDTEISVRKCLWFGVGWTQDSSDARSQEKGSDPFRVWHQHSNKPKGRPEKAERFESRLILVDYLPTVLILERPARKRRTSRVM